MTFYKLKREGISNHPVNFDLIFPLIFYVGFVESRRGKHPEYLYDQITISEKIKELELELDDEIN